MTIKTTKFALAFAFSSAIFFCFAIPTVYYGLQTREARALAQQYFEILEENAINCAGQNGGGDCEALAQQRKDFDQRVSTADRYLNITMIFVVFAVFLPMLIWAAYFLTQAVFGSDSSNGNSE